MSKSLYFQDGHFSGVNSAYYISNYFNDNLLLLDELIELANQYKCDKILDGGDLLHTPEPSYRVLDEIANRVEKGGIPIYSLFGNHASLYHDIKHSRYTGLAHLQKRSDYFRYLGNKFQGLDDCIIQGIEYSHNVEEEIKKDGIIFNPKYNDFWKIAIVHAFVCPKKFPYASHVVCSDIKTNADLVLVAHYHSQWKKKVNNTQFIDIGCLGRRSITERDIKPTVLILDTDKREIKEIELKSAKKGSEIFDLSKVSEEKEVNEGLDEFIKSLESKSFQGVNLREKILYAGKELNIDKEPIELLTNKLDKLEQNNE